MLILFIDMNIAGLEAFWAAFREGSLRRAGRVLSRSQPALTYQLRAFEEALGKPLFERRGKRLVPTEAARRLAPVVGDLLGRLRDLPRQARALQEVREGTLQVVTNWAMGPEALAATLRRFWKSFPRVRIEAINLPHEALRERIRTGLADLGITSAGDLPPGLEARPLARYRYVLLSSGPGSVRRLLQEEQLLLGVSSTPYRELVDGLFARLRVRPSIRGEIAAIEHLPALVRAGLGVTILPEYALSTAQARGLHVHPLDGELGRHAIRAVSRPTAFLPPAAVEFESMLGEELTRLTAEFRRRVHLPPL